MGTVHLTSGHHGLFIREPNADLSRRVKLDPTWLERPILLPGGSPAPEVYQKFAKAALRALLALPVDAAISYGLAGLENPCLQEPKRVWGELTLGDPKNVIVAFSHDTRKANVPYTHLANWTEGPFDHPMPEEILEGVMGGWNQVKWKSFFLRRLKSAEDKLREKAMTMQTEAGALQRRANKIGSLLR